MTSRHVLPLLLVSCFLPYRMCSNLQRDCAAVSCLACPANHKAVTSEKECCPRCIPQCPCPRFLMGPCIEEGHYDGILLQGESVYTDFGKRKCTCISGTNITCVSTCPPIPPECKYIGSHADGCPMCACSLEDGINVIAAGNTIKRKCKKVCDCPSNGGTLKCRLIC